MTPREWRRKLKELGDRYDRDLDKSGKTHFKLVCRQGLRPFVLCSSSSADRRALKNIETNLRHAEKPHKR